MASTAQIGLQRDGCSKLFKTFDIALKKSERHLVLSTTYGLNSSWSKKITVGLRLRLDGSFEPVIKLINNYSSGVSMCADAWAELVAKFPAIDEYLDKDDRTAGKMGLLFNDTIPLHDKCKLLLTTAHGSRVVAFYSENGQIDSLNDGDDNEDVSGGAPPSKKCKHYTPVIVMQKGTFDGLKHIACCVNEHLLRLESLVDEVNRCKGALVQYFASVLKTRKMKAPTLQQIGVIVCDESETARETVSLQSASDFREQCFGVVFYELMRLFMAYIIADIRQCILTDSTV